jgi:hypothetical protein
MSRIERIAEALRRSIPHLPAEGKAMVESMLDPTMLTLIGGTLLVWIGSHAFGIGEFVDLVLLGAGVVTLGFSAFDGAKALYDFATHAVGARTESDLDQAGQSFARAVLILGASTVQAILLHGQARAALARGAPKMRPPPDIGPMPSTSAQLSVSRPRTLPGGIAGGTTAFGDISVARDQALTEQRITLLRSVDAPRAFSWARRLRPRGLKAGDGRLGRGADRRPSPDLLHCYTQPTFAAFSDGLLLSSVSPRLEFPGFHGDRANGVSGKSGQPIE